MRVFTGENGNEYRILFSFNALVNFEEATGLTIEKVGNALLSPKTLRQLFRFALESGEGRKYSEKHAGEVINDILKVTTNYDAFALELYEEFNSAFAPKEEMSEAVTGNESAPVGMI